MVPAYYLPRSDIMERLLDEEDYKRGEIFRNDEWPQPKQIMWEADCFQITNQGLEQINKLANPAGL